MTNSNIELALLCIALERVFTTMVGIENSTTKKSTQSAGLKRLGDLLDDLLGRAEALREVTK